MGEEHSELEISKKGRPSIVGAALLLYAPIFTRTMRHILVLEWAFHTNFHRHPMGRPAAAAAALELPIVLHYPSQGGAINRTPFYGTSSSWGTPGGSC